MPTADRKRGPLVPEDLYDFAWVSDPQMSPDGGRVAYVLTKPERRGKKYTSEVWLVSTAPTEDGKGARRFTAGPRDRAPRWSPCGRYLAFISDRGDGTQVWLIHTDGGEAQQLTGLKGGVTGEPTWSPDGSHLAVLHRQPEPVDAETAAAAASVSDPADPDASKSDVRAFTRLHYKDNGKGFWDGKYAHVYVVPVSGTEQPRQLTSGPYDDASPAWSPCGRYLAFTSNRTPDPDRTPVSDVHVVEVAGGEPRRLTASQGPAAMPTWSPNGELIAYYGHQSQFGGATEAHVFVVRADGATPQRDITAAWDGGAGIAAGSDMMTSSTPGPAWTPDSKAVMFQATERGAVNIYKALVHDGGYDDSRPAAVALPITTGQHAIYAVSYNTERTSAAVALATMTNPGDIHIYASLGPTLPPVPCCCGEIRGPVAVRLTSVNSWLAERQVTMPEEFTCLGPDGGRVHGWLMKPIGFTPGATHPLVVEIHGGPHTAYGWAFSHEFQILAGRGLAVMFCNPGGSTSYGQEFATLTRHDWGGRDYRDVMAATEYVAAKPWIDDQRMGVTGGSYGGYLTNWIIGQTNRFAAAVAQRSTSNRYSQFGTSDIGYYNGNFEFKGNPWDEPDFYLARSPITYVSRVDTPLLLIHSENDLRCPIEQGEQMYTALRWLGKTCEFVRFPDEHHELSRSGQPIHRVERLTRIADWFSKYLAPNK